MQQRDWLFAVKETGQSRTASLTEACTNIAIGLVVAFASQEIIFAWYGIHLSVSVNVKMCLWFTLISLARSYIIRRAFNWITLQ